jgi:hypothetical protein
VTCVYLGRIGHGYAPKFILFVFYVLCRGRGKRKTRFGYDLEFNFVGSSGGE